MYILWQLVSRDAGGRTVPTRVTAGAAWAAVTLWLGSAIVMQATRDHAVIKVWATIGMSFRERKSSIFWCFCCVF